MLFIENTISDFGDRIDPLDIEPTLRLKHPGEQIKPATIAAVAMAFTLLSNGGGGGVFHAVETNGSPEAISNPGAGFCSGCEANETGDPRTVSTPVHQGESFLIQGRNGENRLVFEGDETRPVGPVTILAESGYGKIIQYTNENGDLVTWYSSNPGTTP